MKKVIKLLTILTLLFVLIPKANAQVKYGIIAYRYVKNTEGKRSVKYYTRSSIYNSPAEAKASVDIWYKPYEKIDSDIVYDVISQDVAADNAAKVSYKGSFTAKVRDKNGVESTIEDVKYCYYKSAVDVQEATIVTLNNTYEIIEPVKFIISPCKS